MKFIIAFDSNCDSGREWENTSGASPTSYVHIFYSYMVEAWIVHYEINFLILNSKVKYLYIQKYKEQKNAANDTLNGIHIYIGM